MFRRKGPSDVEVARNNEIKIGVTQELSKALKNVQKESVETGEQRVYSTETANSVVHCLEAVFLHGIKSSSVKKIASMVGLSQEALSQQSLNFWNFAAKFTHSEVVSQLKHLGQITSEIGLCRAWVRMALNDCLIESYVDAMVSDKKTLDYYYHRTAYLRDSEQPEIMKSLIHGLMTFEFKLSYNSSVLNEWSYAPLRLAGIINMNDAPLPVIKPASKPPRPKSSSNMSDGDVRPVRHGTSDRSKKSKRRDNPMEQPTFGAPSESSYYITSSEFTSKDVEDFKKLATLSSPVAKSECSTSSHVSCPDPPNLNLSPAAYVQNQYSDYSGSPMSSRTGLSVGSLEESGNSRDSVKHGVGDSRDLVREGVGDVVTAKLDKRDNVKSQGDGEFPVVSQPSQELLDEIYSEIKDDQSGAFPDGRSSVPDDLPSGKAPDLPDGVVPDRDIVTNELEESWEEFYKSPVKKVASDHPFQRLESFHQEIKEKQILDSFVPSDEEEEGEKRKGSGDVATVYEDVKDSGAVYDDILTQADQVLPSLDNSTSDKNSSKKENIFTDDEFNAVLNKIQQEVQENIKKKLDTSGNSNLDISEITTNKDISKENDSLGSLTKASMSKDLEEDNSSSSDVKPQAYIEEIVAIDGVVGDEQIEHRTSSPIKKKRGKRRSSGNILKPNLSLSPPDRAPLEPELSDAIADKVDRIQTLENPDYLRKHRMSLPMSSKGSISSQSSKAARKKGERKSLPNVLEDQRADTGGGAGVETLAHIQEHLQELYDGKPLDAGSGSNNGGDMEEQITEEEEEVLREKMMSVDHRQSVGNNLMLTGRGWSSSFDSEQGDTVDAFSPPRSQGTFPVTARPKAESFGTILQNYTPASSASAPSMDDVLQHFKRKDTVISPSKSGPSSTPEDYDPLDGFEVVTQSDHPDPAGLERLTQVVDMANEMGLDAQNFQCKGCSRALGLIFGKPRVCKYDGGYYCYECHENEEYYIPAVILHNWDFRKHKVCKKNLGFLQEIEEQPCINVEESNPRLYDHVQEMREIKALRQQLMYLKTYLFTCKQSIAEDLRRLVWPRDYLFENMELYSLADLLQVPTGALANSLRKVIRFATKHVYGCPLCNQKGFICELCNNPKVIYPFEVESTFRCPQCKSVFHQDCKTDNRPCPKCQRRLLRESTHGISESVTTPVYDYIMP